MKKVKTYRASKLTIQQLSELANHLGESEAGVIALALDRLHQKEIPSMYYASHNPYGVTTHNRDGNQANKLHRFQTVQERDQWVEQEPRHRESVSSDGELVERCKQVAVKIGWPVSYME